MMGIFRTINAFYNQNRKLLTTLFRITVSAVLLGWVLFSIDWSKFFTSFQTYKYWVAAITFAFFCANFIINSLKLKILLSASKVEQSLPGLIALHWSSNFLSNFLPTTFGGDVYKFYVLQKENQGKGEEILLSMVVSRLVGFVAMIVLNLVLASVIILTGRSLIVIGSALWWLEIGLLAGLILLAVMWWQQTFFSNLFAHIFPKKKIFDRLLSILNKLKSLPAAALLKVFALSFLYGGISCFAFSLHYWAAGIQPEYISLFYVASLVFLSGVLPVTLNGLGLNEFIQVVLLQELMISSEVAVFVAFIKRVLALMYSLPGSIFLLFNNFANVRKDMRVSMDNKVRGSE